MGLTLRAPLLAAAALACGGDPTSSAPVAAIEVTTSRASIRAGDSLSFRARLTDAEGGQVHGREIAWTSSDPSRLQIAVSADSIVAEALAIGPVTVIATSGEVSGQLAITIVPAFASIEPAMIRTCGLDPDGVAYCWGRYDQEEIALPRRVAGEQLFSSIANSISRTCALTSAGVAYCWRLSTATPELVAGGLTFGSLARGAAQAHHCGLTDAGAAYCWGLNRSGQLGNGTTHDTLRTVPAPVSGGSMFTSIVTGFEHTCALLISGAVQCWGDNAYGQLGDGTTTDRTTPVVVDTDLRFATITAGGGHTCGLTADHAAYCWGRGSSGELGDGSASDRLVPTPVAGDLEFVDLSAGAVFFTCGLTSDGAAYCWGANTLGQLGSTGAPGRVTPQPVDGGHTFALLRAGNAGACGLTVAGRALCWGVGGAGQLGHGLFQDSFTPVFVKNPVIE
jgi:alpha-tubulin suppressor-like RCC1 family protein